MGSNRSYGFFSFHQQTNRLELKQKKNKYFKRMMCCCNNRFENIMMSSNSPNFRLTFLTACIFLASGVGQPLVMQICKSSGLADSSAQLYMLAYYIGPASLVFTLFQWDNNNNNNNNESGSTINTFTELIYKKSTLKAIAIAIMDIAAQSLNYTGATLAGATIFAVIYSSVTIWTAVFSVIILHRSLSIYQWISIFIVFSGLTYTATDSVNLGHDVIRGTILILFGSCLHGGTYVFSEAIMIGNDQLTPRQNTSIQGLVACTGYLLWQIFYTIPRWEHLIEEPMEVAETSNVKAILIMLSFSLLNLAHSYSFYHTLKYFPGGSTSAGVMKGLQAVIVFIAAHFLFCNHHGLGQEMCFSRVKLISLILVVGGVMLFGYFTRNNYNMNTISKSIISQKQHDVTTDRTLLVPHVSEKQVEYEEEEGYGSCQR